jgi:hypothetical protein
VTRAEYEQLRRARRWLQTIPQPFWPALQLIDRVLWDAQQAFKVEDVYWSEQERKSQ